MSNFVLDHWHIIVLGSLLSGVVYGIITKGTHEKTFVSECAKLGGVAMQTMSGVQCFKVESIQLVKK